LWKLGNGYAGALSSSRGQRNLPLLGIGLLPEENRHFPNGSGALAPCSTLYLSYHLRPLIPLGHDLDFDQLVGLKSPIDGIEDRGRYASLADLDKRFQVMSQPSQKFSLGSLEHRTLLHRSADG